MCVLFLIGIIMPLCINQWQLEIKLDDTIEQLEEITLEYGKRLKRLENSYERKQ